MIKMACVKTPPENVLDYKPADTLDVFAFIRSCETRSSSRSAHSTKVESADAVFPSGNDATHRSIFHNCPVVIDTQVCCIGAHAQFFWHNVADHSREHSRHAYDHASDFCEHSHAFEHGRKGGNIPADGEPSLGEAISQGDHHWIVHVSS